jgi:formylglycine-generating enzyme required for sulfatase activity
VIFNNPFIYNKPNLHNMRQISLIGSILIVPFLLLSQNECYDNLLTKGIKQYNAFNYDEAIVKWQGAMACPEINFTQKQDLNAWIEKAKKKDQDDDGWKDSDDDCPSLHGIVIGCPDSDNDGVIDKDDKCPNQKGDKNNLGCPDSDNDGVIDKDDKCPNQKGDKNNLGCPDSDNDGVIDKDDKCPNQKGNKNNQGCPIVAFFDFEELLSTANSCKMIAIKGDSFLMGSNKESDEKPIHKVTLSDFYIGKYEITQKQWRGLMGSDPLELKFKGCDECPVENISWNDVQEFLQKLNSKTGKKYRLPTEAEWEYTARGGNKSQGYIYSGSNGINNVAQYEGNNNKNIKPVGTKKANELGIYDMSGNVYEWCGDWYGEKYYSSSPTNNPSGSSVGKYRVLRGGAWYNNLTNCRVVNRNADFPDVRYGNNGFRICLSR